MHNTLRIPFIIVGLTVGAALTACGVITAAPAWAPSRRRVQISRAAAWFWSRRSKIARKAEVSTKTLIRQRLHKHEQDNRRASSTGP